MPVNKDIIIRIVLGLGLFFIALKVVGPVIFDLLKRKIPGAYNPDNDIDSMIKRQKTRLRSEYGLMGTDNDVHSPSETTSTSIPKAAPTKEIENLYKETRWGGGDFAKNLQSEITKNYGYTLTESKVNAFVLLAEKRNYFGYLSLDNQKNKEALIQYLSMLMLLLILIEEIRNKEFNLLSRVAKKCRIDTMEMALTLQLKILFAVSSKKAIKEERLFESTLGLHHYSEDSMKEAVDIILKREANLWAKGHSFFFEELSLYLNYADILTPTPKLQNKKDLQTAYSILKVNEDMELEEIKKAYKRLAMIRHPDKIGQLKLPSTLEKKAVAKFNQIQEAYDVIVASRKK